MQILYNRPPSLVNINLTNRFHMQDEDAFFKDYAESHKKLSELGFTPPGMAKAFVNDSIIIAQSAVGVAVAAAVVILSYFYEVKKRMK